MLKSGSNTADINDEEIALYTRLQELSLSDS